MRNTRIAKAPIGALILLGIAAMVGSAQAVTSSDRVRRRL